MSIARLAPAILALSSLACGVESARESAAPSDLYVQRESTPGSERIASDSAPSAPTEMAPLDAPQARKIIYEATIELTVEDLDAAVERLVRQVEAVGGFLSKSEVRGTPGASRSGTWTVRVPVEQFDVFLDQVTSIGERRLQRTDSRDVTEEFYDIEARLKNKQRGEERLLRLLDEATASLKDTLDVERELNRVREEIERMEGRLRLLSDLTALSTVTISMQERRGYVPPEAPGFRIRAARTFGGSFEVLRQFGEGLALALVALLPWLPVLAIILVLAWWFVRRGWLARR